jgi:hypothetical protein
VPVRLPLVKVTARWNPLTDCPWNCVPFTLADIRRFKPRMQSLPVEDDAFDWRPHAGRIRYLAKHGWKDPIQLDAGIPSLNCYVDWPIQDGNHRLAAAILRGDDGILAQVAGDLEYALELFGVDCQESSAAEEIARA